jgi:hypothetical protein
VAQNVLLREEGDELRFLRRLQRSGGERHGAAAHLEVERDQLLGRELARGPPELSANRIVLEILDRATISWTAALSALIRIS